MLNNFLEGGGKVHNSYRHKLLAMSEQLESALLDFEYMDKDAADKHLQTKELTYIRICETAETSYRTLFDKNEWPPARSAV